MVTPVFKPDIYIFFYNGKYGKIKKIYRNFMDKFLLYLLKLKLLIIQLEETLFLYFSI